jgi:S-adenosylmethionine-diacylgycerolhomoserine-N-methlytransferase
VSLPEPGAAARFGVEALDRFYRWQAPIYDWTRPFFLFGRAAALEDLAARAGDRVLDVGCGTGWSAARLAAGGARVTGVEPSQPMRTRAAARAERFELDARPYGTHDDYFGAVERVLFSYSLSMIPPFQDVIDRARQDLRPGGRIAVVDFLDARAPFHAWLTHSHVFLGPERLDALRAAFPAHRVRLRNAFGWRFFQLVAEA